MIDLFYFVARSICSHVQLIFTNQEHMQSSTINIHKSEADLQRNSYHQHSSYMKLTVIGILNPSRQGDCQINKEKKEKVHAILIRVKWFWEAYKRIKATTVREREIKCLKCIYMIYVHFNTKSNQQSIRIMYVGHSNQTCHFSRIFN